jgi:hypothetical protein
MPMPMPIPIPMPIPKPMQTLTSAININAGGFLVFENGHLGLGVFGRVCSVRKEKVLQPKHAEGVKQYIILLHAENNYILNGSSKSHDKRNGSTSDCHQKENDGR